MNPPLTEWGLIDLPVCNPWDLSVWGLPVLPVATWVRSRCSGFLPQAKERDVRLIGADKLAVGVNESIKWLPVSLC